MKRLLESVLWSFKLVIIYANLHNSPTGLCNICITLRSVTSIDSLIVFWAKTIKTYHAMESTSSDGKGGKKHVRQASSGRGKPFYLPPGFVVHEGENVGVVCETAIRAFLRDW